MATTKRWSNKATCFHCNSPLDTGRATGVALFRPQINPHKLPEKKTTILLYSGHLGDTRTWLLCGVRQRDLASINPCALHFSVFFGYFWGTGGGLCWGIFWKGDVVCVAVWIFFCLLEGEGCMWSPSFCFGSAWVSVFNKRSFL